MHAAQLKELCVYAPMVYYIERVCGTKKLCQQRISKGVRNALLPVCPCWLIRRVRVTMRVLQLPHPRGELLRSRTASIARQQNYPGQGMRQLNGPWSWWGRSHAHAYRHKTHFSEVRHPGRPADILLPGAARVPESEKGWFGFAPAALRQGHCALSRARRVRYERKREWNMTPLWRIAQRQQTNMRNKTLGFSGCFCLDVCTCPGRIF